MIYYVLTAIIGILLGGGITYIVCRYLPQEEIREINFAKLEEYDEQIHRREINLKAKEEELRKYQDKISDITYKYKLSEQQVQNEIKLLNQEKEQVIRSISDLRKQAKESANSFYETETALAQERFDRTLEAIAKKFQEQEREYEEEYLLALSEMAEEFAAGAQAQRDTYNSLQSQLAELTSTVEAAVAASKREEEKRTAKDFYRIVLSDTDLQEIGYLRQVEPFLRDKEALNKVIWKVYYEKPFTDMIGRVVGQKTRTGIYKITNIQNGMSYVGQAVDLASRFRQHCKRGIGAEAPTRNKLYPAMLSIGVHNFTFEIIEDCERNKLDEREDYWQEFYHCMDYGYSIK